MSEISLWARFNTARLSRASMPAQESNEGSGDVNKRVKRVREKSDGEESDRRKKAEGASEESQDAERSDKCRDTGGGRDYNARSSGGEGYTHRRWIEVGCWPC